MKINIESLLDHNVDKEAIALSIIEQTQELLLNDSHGIYIPQIALESFDINLSECWEDVKKDCLNPDSEHYWDSWDNVLGNGTINGKSLHQDGDLWLVDHDARQTAISDLYDVGVDIEDDMERLLSY